MNSFIIYFLHDFLSVIIRPIINNDQFPVLISLIADRFNGFSINNTLLYVGNTMLIFGEGPAMAEFYFLSFSDGRGEKNPQQI